MPTINIVWLPLLLLLALTSNALVFVPEFLKREPFGLHFLTKKGKIESPRGYPIKVRDQKTNKRRLNMPATVVTDTHQLPPQWWNYLSKSHELLLQRNGQPAAVLLSFDHFMTLKEQLASRQMSIDEPQFNEQAQLDEKMRAAALALLDDYTNDAELTIFTTALGGEEFYDYDE